MYKKEFIISNNDVDYRFNLKPANLFRLFQDIALKATEEVGSDSISLAKRGIDWVITRMDVEIKRLPRCNEKITVCTYPGKDLAMLYPRYFYILDENNEAIVKSSSIWALIDAKTRKVIIDKDTIKKLPPETSEYELPLPGKIAPSENKALVETRTIHYSDLDFNCHMNNVRYVELLMDVHDFDFYKTHRPSFISLNYMKEIKEKNQVSVYSDSNNPETFEVQVDGGTSFLAKVTFVEE